MDDKSATGCGTNDYNISVRGMNNLENKLLDNACLEIGDGWQQLVQGLCEEIVDTYRRVNLPTDISVEQVKSKYGELRFYYFHEDNGEDGELECEFKLQDEVESIVEKWVAKSKTTCEWCGKPGSLHNSSGWMEVLCDKCLKA